MNKMMMLILSGLILTACGGGNKTPSEQDLVNKQLELQQKEIELQKAQLQQMQQQVQQNQANNPNQNATPQNQQNQDNTVYQLNPSAVNQTIPEQYRNGNNGQPVTGTDGQQYTYDSSTGSWILSSLIGSAAGAFIGNALANKFMKAPDNSTAAQQVRTRYYQSQPYTGKATTITRSLPAPAASANQANNNNTNKPVYRQVQPSGSVNQSPSTSNTYRPSNATSGGNRLGAFGGGMGRRRR